MGIVLHLDALMEERGVSVTELAAAVGINRVNMSNLKNGKVNAVRFSTLNAICRELHCQPGDILEYVDG
ncbi:MAG: helix-turn-helix domain-containing protein [Coriobacteriales bacterium]